MFIRIIVLSLFGLTAIWVAPALAQGTVTLTNKVFQEVEVKGPDGKIERKLEPAARVVPGTEVLYVITYRNIGTEPADKVVVTNPVPEELEYVSSSAETANTVSTVSVNGGKSFGLLTQLTITSEDGKTRPAKPSDVTQVRWTLKRPIDPGSDGTVSFRARLK